MWAHESSREAFKKRNNRTPSYPKLIRPGFVISYNKAPITMKTITVNGSPEGMTAIMVPKSETPYHDHDTVTLQSADGKESEERTIFRVVDAGEDKWELQFE
jgi:hypothetical protein